MMAMTYDADAVIGSHVLYMLNTFLSVWATAELSIEMLHLYKMLTRD